MKLHHLLMGTALALVMPVVASAQSLPEGVYLGSQIGVNWLQDSDHDTATLTNKVSAKEAIAAVLEAGYQFGDGLRIGVEGGYSVHEVDGISGGPATRIARAIGDTTTFTLMGVVQKEFDIGSPFRPYVGAGAGWGWVNNDAVGPLFSNTNYSESAQDSFAYQLNAGVAYALADNLDLTMGYRYQAIDNLKFKNETPTFKREYDSHTLFIGVRTVFGAAPAKPVAAPAPAPAVVAPPPPPAVVAPAPTITRNFTVFFDFDRAVLSSDAQQVLQNVARDAKTGQVMAISISGHADTSGSPEYNQKLSQRRAEAVREYLVSQGLGANQIAVEAKGETDLLVPTADGVREPSNRRAVILFP